ncbi:unnamed protein product [Acanthosepion pharaonis]|uniref:Uncharacterized protein n=1 Tax=Acanthosepion pharaonis TaxID=158019 RepID=A0A812EFK2_ACAPH|nr:unnamed protein product [Sepia pharaonis]
MCVHINLSISLYYYLSIYLSIYLPQAIFMSFQYVLPHSLRPFYPHSFSRLQSISSITAPAFLSGFFYRLSAFFSKTSCYINVTNLPCVFSLYIFPYVLLFSFFLSFILSFFPFFLFFRSFFLSFLSFFLFFLSFFLSFLSFFLSFFPLPLISNSFSLSFFFLPHLPFILFFFFNIVLPGFIVLLSLSMCFSNFTFPTVFFSSPFSILSRSIILCMSPFHFPVSNPIITFQESG